MLMYFCKKNVMSTTKHCLHTKLWTKQGNGY